MDENRLQALRNQVKRLQGRLRVLRQTSYRYSWLRLITFIGGALVCAFVFYFFGPWLGLVALIPALAVFGTTVYYHRLFEDSIARHQIWLGIKSAHIARMSLDWERIPSNYRYRPRQDHPFEGDLDIVGDRSLHRLIDTGVSYEGSRRLRRWLTAPVPDLAQTLRRQQLVKELTPLSLFRDKLILNTTIAPSTRRTWDAQELTTWLQRQPLGLSYRRWLIVTTAMAVLNVLLFLGNVLDLVPPIWQITFLLYLGLVLFKSRDTGTVFEDAMTLQDALRQLGAAFRLLETRSFHNAPHLGALCAPFRDHAHRPSRYLTRLNRIVAAMGVRGNPFIWFMLNALLPWDLFFAQQLKSCKEDLVEKAPAWAEVWFELEALNSLASFAYLNPEYTLPHVNRIEDKVRPFVFKAEGLGHPLIPHADKVCNDFSIEELGALAIITGSNMAGKSVFLKTVGSNLALAYAGGPVNARLLETALFRIFTSIQITDSVIDGISYFYAEVKRLKTLLEELGRTHPLPLLWLIDEIFRGTNNRERLIGSRALVRTLVDMRGVGLIATHDLELTTLADEISGIRNFHFRDAVVEERMAFDYTLRPGPCPTTNALKIMQMEGLPVPTAPTADSSAAR
jgi:hypothetical protein